MNWLAHVLLSENNVEHRLGNLLADLVRGDARAAMSEDFRRGAELHHAIDAYTDAHAVVRRSRARLSAAHRRFSGVLIDVFYDYFLASSWERHCAQPLEAFTAAFYADVARLQPHLPPDAARTLARIVQHDLLSAYRRIEGVERSLQRLSTYLAGRWRRQFALETSVAELRALETELAADFAEFFPMLAAYAAERMRAPQPR